MFRSEAFKDCLVTRLSAQAPARSIGPINIFFAGNGMNGNAMSSFMDFGRSPEWGRCNEAVLCMGQAYAEWGRLSLCNLKETHGACV